MDFVVIFDGIENSPFMIKSIGWNHFGRSISTTQNNMVVQFFTDNFGTATGFNASIHYTLKDATCEPWLKISFSERIGKLESPYYPDLFNNSASCNWLLFIPQSNIENITLEFETLAVSQYFKYVNIYIYTCLFIHLQFPNDLGYLLVYDGGSSHSKIISNITDGMAKNNISGTGNQIFIKLSYTGSIKLSINIKFEICKCIK